MAKADADLIREHLETVSVSRTQTRTICPACGPERKKKNERTLSVKLDEGAAVYLCHHCGIAGVVPLSEPEPNSEVVPKKPSGLNEAQISWLQSRGISPQTAEKCGLTSAKVFLRTRSAEVDCVGFHYLNSDGTTATKWRDGSKNFSQTGAARSLWRIEDWDSGDLVVCEGEIDSLSFEQIGIPSVSVPNGAPSTLSDGSNGGKYAYLWDAKAKIERATRIILATDNDEPGRLLSEEIARRIGKARCWRLVYPDDCKDANDVLTTLGEAALKDVVAGATPWPVNGLRDVAEFRSEVMSIYQNGLDHGIKIGVPELDNIFRVCPQTLTICTGIPGSGKSSFLSWMTVQLASRHNWSTAILSAETPPTILLLQMAAIYKSQSYLGKSKMSEPELAQALDWLKSRYVILDDSDTSIASVLERAQAAVLRMGVRCLVIDPFNFLTGSVSGAEEGSVTNINKILVSLKSFAVEHSVAIFLVAHPIKMYRQSDGKVPVPTGYDVSGSSSFYNVCDAGITVSRSGGESLFTMWKARFPWIGKPGSVEMNFDPNTGIFSSALGAWGDMDGDDWADI
jgi:twinkle protein